MDGQIFPWISLRTEKLCGAMGTFQPLRRRFRQSQSGKEGNFFIVECSDWVQTIAITTGGEIVLVEQYRFGSERFSLEPPGGCINAGEPTIAAAERELLEETGYAGENPRLIASFFPNPAFQNNQLHCVFIENCRPIAGQQLDPLEEVRFLTFPPEEVFEKIRRQEINHALSIAALLMAKDRILGMKSKN
ncbi:MAG: NUDIX hydrolase [Puniceicoccales bacterium]|jgi:8-oxo-dGTP pyrophosphatase MutT (NUDIX family)|nr:NUDIX hydrolase [Puniceicoccales bacterium]